MNTLRSHPARAFTGAILVGTLAGASLGCTGSEDGSDVPELLGRRAVALESGPTVAYRFELDDEIRELTLGLVDGRAALTVRDEQGTMLAGAMRSASGHVLVVDGDRELVAAGEHTATLPEGALDQLAARLLTDELIASLPADPEAPEIDPRAFEWLRAGDASPEFRRIYGSLGPDGGCIAWDTPQGGIDFVCWEAPFFCC
jgi:hypothetical protein